MGGRVGAEYLRIARSLGTRRVDWSLVVIVSLLAMLVLMVPVNIAASTTVVRLPDALYRHSASRPGQSGTTPADTTGTVNIIVQNPDGQSSNARFTYSNSSGG
jgi:hypothetical protein